MNTERNRSYGSNTSERRVSSLAKEAGLTVSPAASITISEPVYDKEGYLRKTVTVPDFHIIDPETGSVAIIEVTKGSGNNAHKDAQRRVVEAAHVENYFLITGDIIDSIDECPTPEAKREAFYELFSWQDTHQDDPTALK